MGDSYGTSAKAQRMRVPGNRRSQRKGKGKGMSLDALGEKLKTSQADAQDSRNRQRRRAKNPDSGVIVSSGASTRRANKMLQGARSANTNRRMANIQRIAAAGERGEIGPPAPPKRQGKTKAQKQATRQARKSRTGSKKK